MYKGNTKVPYRANLGKGFSREEGLAAEINDKVDFRGVLFVFSNLFVIFAVNFGI